MNIHVFLILMFSVMESIYCIYEEFGDLLGYKDGFVRNESFIYFYIHHLGNIIIVLNSNNGDADLYISQSNFLPTYEINSYDLHSATCGVDAIDVPENFGSPIAVGIYGHPAYEISSFTLEIYKKSSMSDTGSLLLITDEIPEDEELHDKKVSTSIDPGPRKYIKTKVKRKSERVTNKLGGIFSIFEIFQLIFL